MGLRMVRYTSERAPEWDEFVDRSKNGTFLFQRRYMEYHSDQYPDHSYMVYDGKRVVALFAATPNGDRLVSHAGLTYGGLVTDERMTVALMKDVFDLALPQFREDGFKRLDYKTVPHIYHRLPSDEDLYCLFLYGARLERRDVLTVLDYSESVRPQGRRERGLRRAVRLGLEVRESDRYRDFWEILSASLRERHATRPVHSLEQIELLASRFPQNIELHACFARGEMLAGAVLYLSSRVCHVQYNATSDEGRLSGALDRLFQDLIEAQRGRVRFFDFGVSTESAGRRLNEGLVSFKEGFGGRTAVHDFYALDLGSHG